MLKKRQLLESKRFIQREWMRTPNAVFLEVSGLVSRAREISRLRGCRYVAKSNQEGCKSLYADITIQFLIAHPPCE